MTHNYVDNLCSTVIKECLQKQTSEDWLASNVSFSLLPLKALLFMGYNFTPNMFFTECSVVKSEGKYFLLYLWEFHPSYLVTSLFSRISSISNTYITLGIFLILIIKQDRYIPVKYLFNNFQIKVRYKLPVGVGSRKLFKVAQFSFTASFLWYIRWGQCLGHNRQYIQKFMYSLHGEWDTLKLKKFAALSFWFPDYTFNDMYFWLLYCEFILGSFN